MNSMRYGIAANWLAHVRRMNARNARRVILAETRALREDGFDSAELPVPHAEAAFARLGLSFWREIGEEMRALGVEPVSAHGPSYPGLDEDARAAARRLRAYARIARALGLRALVVHPAFHSHLHVCAVQKQVMPRDVRFSLEISDELGDGGPALAIENLPQNSWRYLEALFDRVTRPNVGLCFDTGHYLLRPERPLRDILSAFGDRLVHWHFNDNHGLCDEHLPPGEGTFPWPDIRACRALRRASAIVEISPPILAQNPAAASVTRRMHRHALACLRRRLSG